MTSPSRPSGAWRVAFVAELGQAFAREMFAGVAAFTRQHDAPWTIQPVELHHGALLRQVMSSSHAALATVLTYGLPRLAARAGIPLINLATYGVGRTPVSVTTDNEAIGRMAATYLIERGHRTFAVLRFPRPDALDIRKEAFRQAVAEAGHPCLDLEFDLFDVRRASRALTAQLADIPRPVGLYCRTDALAFRLLPILEQAGLAVPGDIAVVGTDNDEMLCETSRPSLTSIELGVDRIGYRAAEVLLDWLRGRPPPDGVERIAPITVVERASTRLWAVGDKLVARALDRIEEAPLGSLNVQQLAHDLGVFRRTLDRRFQSVLGRTPADVLRRRQLDRACQLLTETDWTVARVAEACGMPHPEHLSRFMRQRIGLSPAAFRQQRKRG